MIVSTLLCTKSKQREVRYLLIIDDTGKETLLTEGFEMPNAPPLRQWLDKNPGFVARQVIHFVEVEKPL